MRHIMKRIATVMTALILATGAAQAASYNTGNPDADMPTAPVVAANTVTVKASDVMTAKERERAHVAADADLTVSDFSAPGPRSTYVR